VSRVLGLLLLLAAGWYAYRQRLDDALIDALTEQRFAPAPLIVITLVVVVAYTLLFPRR